MNILRTTNITYSSYVETTSLKNIKQPGCLSMIKILKNKKINCLIISNKINDFFRYHLNLHKIMILATQKLSDFNRIQSLTHTEGNFLGKAKTISSIFINKNHHILLTQFEEFSDLLTILIKSDNTIIINVIKYQLLKLICLFKIALSDHRLLIGCGYTELFIFIKFKKLIVKTNGYYDKLKISRFFLWFYLKLNNFNLNINKSFNSVLKNTTNKHKKLIYDYYILKWQSLRTIFLLLWDLININQENKLIVEKLPF